MMDSTCLSRLPKADDPTHEIAVRAAGASIPQLPGERHATITLHRSPVPARLAPGGPVLARRRRGVRHAATLREPPAHADRLRRHALRPAGDARLRVRGDRPAGSVERL